MAQKKESPMMKQFRDLKAKHPDALLLFRCGDFYESYEDDAKACASILGITLTHHEAGYAMAGFPHHSLDPYLPRLIRAGRRVAICDQLEDPKLTKRLVRRGSTELASTATNNNPNNNEKPSTTMATKNINESKNAAQQQVTNEVESVSVGEVTLDSIMPTMTPISEPEPAEPAKAVTLKRKTTLRKKNEAPVQSEPAEPIASEPAAPVQAKARPSYTVLLLPAKSGGEWPKMYGFKSEKEAKAVADKMPGSVRASWDYGQNGEGRETKTRHWYLSAGKRYCGVMQELAAALTQGDRAAVARVCAKAHEVYASVVADGKAKGTAAQAAPKAPAAQVAAKATAAYTTADVAAMLKALLKDGKDLPEDIKQAMAA